VSGAQWSAARLRELARFAGRKETAEALRAFAAVVSVLDGMRALALTYSGSVWIASHERWEGSPSYLASRSARGDNPLAAILALADALDAGRGT
jgi:hypothetical protein